jgi:two-component system LytT family response regulator
MKEKIKTIIIDDEKLAREVIKNYLAGYPEYAIVAECSNGFEGIKAINELLPDLIFLDIQMPKINGFEMLELIDEPPVIVFTTAFDQYALKAFEVNAADYLLKPFSGERFGEALNKANIHLSEKDVQANVIKNLIRHTEKREEYLTRVIIKDGPKITVVTAEDINFIEAQDDYVLIFTEEGKHLKQKTMKYFEENLNPNDFIRVHRSFITAIKKIEKIQLLQKETYQLTLKNGMKIPVSKTGYARLKDLIIR